MADTIHQDNHGEHCYEVDDVKTDCVCDKQRKERFSVQTESKWLTFILLHREETADAYLAFLNWKHCIDDWKEHSEYTKYDQRYADE